MTEGIWTMTESEFAESLRSAKAQAWDEGFDEGLAAGRGSRSDNNPYRTAK
jgi:hypothetical protein